MIVALSPSPSLDLTYEVDELRRGDITRPLAVTHVAGGKALNVARVAHALGSEVHVVAALGGHTGAWISDLLSEDGVTTSFVPLRRTTRLSSAIVEARGGASSTDLYETATPLDADEWDAFRALAVAAAARRPTWVALSGSLPPGVDAAAAAELLRELRAGGSRVAVDSSGAGLAALGSSADLVKVNRAEASEVCGPQAGAQAAARALRAMFGGDAVVTDGIRGAFAMLGDEEASVDAPATRGRFSAGSGDAFLGGLLAGLDAGLSGAEALALARSAAERNAAVPGQGVLSR